MQPSKFSPTENQMLTSNASDKLSYRLKSGKGHVENAPQKKLWRFMSVDSCLSKLPSAEAVPTCLEGAPSSRLNQRSAGVPRHRSFKATSL